MNEEDLYIYFLQSQMFQRWHWFRWHFEHKLRGSNHPLARGIINACLDCEEKMPGFAKNMIDRITSVSGHEKFEPHYEQLLQILAELHVIRQITNYSWPYSVNFEWEPTTKDSKKNPELAIYLRDSVIGIEVKTPSLLSHIRKRVPQRTQLPTRVFPEDIIKTLPNADKGIILPRDNVIKDFLLSADEKFKTFKQNSSDFYSILVIVWDDFVYEPISALLSPDSGLLTENTFLKNDQGYPVKFLNIDSIVIIRHLHQIISATRDDSFIDDCRHMFDYGSYGSFPPKVLINNPHSNTDLLQEVEQCLQTHHISSLYGAEYVPSDLILWI